MKHLLTIFFTLINLNLNLFAQLSPTESKILTNVESNNAEALDLLIKLVNINSGTMNFEGV